MRLAVLFAAAVVLSGGSPGPSSLAQGQDDAAAKAAMLDLLGRLIPAVEAELARDGADPTDVRALARRLGTPQAALQFVREQIAFEPYAGALRGPEGALAARAANSWDQALLLQALLEAIGRPCRIVSAELDEAQCGALVDAFLQAPPRAEPAGDEAPALAEVARSTGIAEAELANLLGRQRQSADAAFAEMQQLAMGHAGVLRAALRDHAVDPAAMRAAALASVRRHAFVQLAVPADGEVRWQDLDASPLGAADGASGARGAAPVETLPQHTLRFQLLYQTSTATTPILDVTTDFAAALREPLAFQVAPADANLPSLERLAASSPADARSLWQKVKLWQAALCCGTTERSSRVFDLDGGLHDVAGDGRVRAAGDLGAAATRGFGGLGGGDDKPAKSTFQQLTLVITVAGPDGSERSFTRRLLDADGRRRGESPAMQWEILACGGPIGSEVGAQAELQAQLLVWRVQRQALAGDDRAAWAAFAETAARPELMRPLLLMRLQQARQRHAAALAARHGVRCTWSTPQLLTLARQALPCAEGKDCVAVRFDWMASDVRFLAADAQHGRAAFDAAMEQGLFDTVLEAWALERLFPGATATSAAHAMERLRAAGLALQPRPAVDGRLAFGHPDGDTWFEVDPVFGCALGRTPGGHGGAFALVYPQGATEYIKMVRAVVWPMFCAFSTVVAYGRGGSTTRLIVQSAGCLLGAGFRVAGAVSKVPLAKELLGLAGDALAGGISGWTAMGN